MPLKDVAFQGPKSMGTMIDAGIEAICQSGVDRISVSQLCKVSKITRPTFYVHFGDISGFLAEVWLLYGEQFLNQLSEPEFQIRNENESLQNRHCALTEILAIAHRVPEILEVVEPAVSKWWNQRSNEPELERLKAVWLVGSRLGNTLTRPIDPNADQATFIELALSSVPDVFTGSLPAISPEILPKVSIVEVTDESLDTQLVQAAIDVIANSGVASASMIRIARKAQVTTGTLYPRFSNLQDLVDSSFELAVRKVVDQNFSLMNNSGFQADDFAFFIMAGLNPARSNWRNFRIEIHLEGRLRPSLAKRMASNLRETNLRLSEKLDEKVLGELAKGPVPYLMHNLGVGFAVLQNAGVLLSSLDHRQISRELINSISKFLAK
jgi:AcrR family transcriptional regulator